MADTETATEPTKEAEAVKEDKKEEIDDAGAEDQNDDSEEKIYQETLPNRVIVARNHPLSYYVDRSRRILRMEEELFVSGRGNS